MKAGGVGLGVGTANDRARERDEELHLKGVRVEERIPHRLSSNPLLPTTPNNFSKNLFSTMDSYMIDNLYVTRVDDRTHYSGIVGDGPYPSSQEVSGLIPLDGRNIDSIGIDLGPIEERLSGQSDRLVV